MNPMTDLSGIGKRLKELRKEKGLSQAHVASELCVTQSAYSLMEGSRNGIISEHVVALSRLFGVTTDFLLTGNRKLIDMSPENGFVPLLETKAQAGFLKKVHQEDVFDSFEHYRIPGYNPTMDSLLVEVEGDSMAPTIMSGEVVICQTQRNPDRVLDGSAAIIVTRNQLLTTRLYRHPDEDYFWMESDNPEYAGKKRISKSEISQLLMVRGKVSNLLIPPREIAYKGKLKSLEESLESLGKEVYQVSKEVQKLKKK